MASEFARKSSSSLTLAETPNLSASAEQHDGWTVVRLKGEIDISTAPSLTGAILSLVEGGRTRLILDFHALKFLDSTGISMLVAVRRKVIELEGELAVAGAQSTVLKVLDLCGISRHLTMFPDIDAALARAEGPLTHQ